MVEKKTRIRRSAKQLLADLEKKQLEIMERQKAAIAKIEEQKRRLLQAPSIKKERIEQENVWRAPCRHWYPNGICGM